MARMNWEKANIQKKVNSAPPERKPRSRKQNPYTRVTEAGPVKITKADGTVVWQEPLKGDIQKVKKSGKKVQKNKDGKATQKQINFMRVLGIPHTPGLTSLAASALISQALKKKNSEQ